MKGSRIVTVPGPIHRRCGPAPPLLAAAVVLLGCSEQADPPRAEADSDLSPEGRAPALVGRVQSGPFELPYIVEGMGRPTIVVGSAKYYQRTFSANLRSHLRLVFMDHRGFAPSPGPVDTTAFSLDTLIADIERVRRHLDLGPVAVVGHSGHAYMALAYAKAYPEHVSHVVMIGISPDLGPASTAARDRYWEDFASAERKTIHEDNVRRLPDEEIARMPVSPGRRFVASYVRDGPHAWYDPHFDSTPLWEGVDPNMDMINYVWGSAFRDIDITRGLEDFDRPVFLALGRYDFLIAPPSAWDPVLPAFQDVSVRIFERSGHTPFHEEAELFDEELLAWMGR
jgi:proline iminopeptidase